MQANVCSIQSMLFFLNSIIQVPLFLDTLWRILSQHNVVIGKVLGANGPELATLISENVFPLSETEDWTKRGKSRPNYLRKTANFLFQNSYMNSASHWDSFPWRYHPLTNEGCGYFYAFHIWEELMWTAHSQWYAGEQP